PLYRQQNFPFDLQGMRQVLAGRKDFPGWPVTGQSCFLHCHWRVSNEIENQMKIEYEHSQNTHELPGPLAAFSTIFAGSKPQSLLDVGCGVGTWLKAAQESGVEDIVGVDGIDTPSTRFLVSTSFFRQQDLTRSWNLGRRFDAAICLEVAEHLDEQYATILVDSLATHSDHIVFGAACPGQSGQHHVNC